MQQLLMGRVRILIVSVCSLFLMVLLSACQGVVSTNGGTNAGSNNGTGNNGSATTLVGAVQSVNAQSHSVTLLVNGQQVTVNGLTDQQIAALQSQVNKTYSIQVTPAGSNTYTISPNTQPQESDNNATSVTTSNNNTNNNGTPVQGSIEFTGRVQGVNNNNVTVSLPNGEGLAVAIINGRTDLSDMNGTQPGAGQTLKIKAVTDQGGNFTATKLSMPKADDQQQDLNTVQYQGMTTSAVGGNNQISFKVGNKSYSYPIGAGADLKDFNGNAQSIGNNIPVKVKVIFNGNSGTAVSVDNGGVNS